MLINRELFKLMGRAKGTVLRASLLVCLGYSFSVLQAYWLSQAISSILNRQTEFLSYGLRIVLAAVLQILLRRPTNRAIADCEEKTKKEIRQRLLTQIFHLGLAGLTEERTGALGSLLLDRVEALAPYYSTYIPYLLTVLFVSLGTIVFLSGIQIGISLFALIGIIGVLAVPMLTYRYLWSTGTAVWREYERFGADFLDNIQGMETLKGLKACRLRKAEMEHSARGIHRKTMKNMKITTIEDFLFEIFAGLGSVLSIAYAAFLALQGILPAFSVLSVLFLARSCFAPVFALMGAWHRGYNGVTASREIDRILAETTAEWPDAWLALPKTQDAAFHVQNLRFSYTPETPVLKDLSPSLPPGKSALS